MRQQKNDPVECVFCGSVEIEVLSTDPKDPVLRCKLCNVVFKASDIEKNDYVSTGFLLRLGGMVE